MNLIEELLLFLSTTFRIIVLWQGLLRAATLMNCGLDDEQISRIRIVG